MPRLIIETPTERILCRLVQVEVVPRDNPRAAFKVWRAKTRQLNGIDVGGRTARQAYKRFLSVIE